MSGDRLYKTASLTTPRIDPNALTFLPNTFIFQPVPAGSVWTGTIQILNSPTTAFHQASISGILWAEWYGFQPSPVLQALNSETIQVVSSGLESSTPYQATLIGRADPANAYDAVWPIGNESLIGVTPIADTSFPPNQSAPNGIVTIIPSIAASTLIIRVLAISGVSNGLLLTITDPTVAPFRTDYFCVAVPFQYEQFVYVPVNGRPTQVQIQAMVNGSPVNTAQVFYVEIFGTSQIYDEVTLGDAATNVAFPGNSLDANVAGGGNLQLITPPVTGFSIFVRNIGFSFIGTPAAANFVLVRGTVSIRAYCRWGVPTGAGQTFTWPNPFIVGASGTDDPGEGLTFFNSLSIQVTVIANWDIIPTPSSARPIS